MRTEIDPTDPDVPAVPASATRPGTSTVERRALLAGAGVLVLTGIHHVYGAILYETPERYHAVFIAAAALFVMLAGRALVRRRNGSPADRIGRWTAWSVNAVVSVLLFGAVEGFYNHVVKVALYFGGLPEARMRVLFRSDLHEMPNDLIFEATGVLQAVPAVLAGYYLVRALRERRRGRGLA